MAWVAVPGFEDYYEVSSDGDLRSLGSGRVLAKNSMGAGYVKADLWKDGGRMQTSVHRIVASAFVPRPDGCDEVNHKNGNKTDNRASNLEWVTRSDNVNHAYYALGYRVNSVTATNCKTGNAVTYPSVEAAVRSGFDSAHIYRCLLGERKTHKGHTWTVTTPPAQGAVTEALEWYAEQVAGMPQDRIVRSAVLPSP